MSELNQLLIELIETMQAQTEAITDLAKSNEAMVNIIADDMGSSDSAPTEL